MWRCNKQLRDPRAICTSQLLREQPPDQLQDQQLDQLQREQRRRDHHDLHCHHYQQDQSDVQRNSACGIIVTDIVIQILWKLVNGNVQLLMSIHIHKSCGTAPYQLESLSIDFGSFA